MANNKFLLVFFITIATIGYGQNTEQDSIPQEKPEINLEQQDGSWLVKASLEDMEKQGVSTQLCSNWEIIKTAAVKEKKTIAQKIIDYAKDKKFNIEISSYSAVSIGDLIVCESQIDIVSKVEDNKISTFGYSLKEDKVIERIIKEEKTFTVKLWQKYVGNNQNTFIIKITED